jgi:hypothetical protein
MDFLWRLLRRLHLNVLHDAAYALLQPKYVATLKGDEAIAEKYRWIRRLRNKSGQISGETSLIVCTSMS